jgi:hypothetical protein
MPNDVARRWLLAEFPEIAEVERLKAAAETAAVWRWFEPGRSYLVGMGVFRSPAANQQWKSFVDTGLPCAPGGFTGMGRNDGVAWVDETIGLLRAACHRAFGEGHGTKFYSVFDETKVKPWGLVLDKTSRQEKVEEEQQT